MSSSDPYIRYVQHVCHYQFLYLVCRCSHLGTCCSVWHMPDSIRSVGHAWLHSYGAWPLCNIHLACTNSSIGPPTLACQGTWRTLCRCTLIACPSMVLKHQSGIWFDGLCQSVHVQIYFKQFSPMWFIEHLLIHRNPSFNGTRKQFL